MNKAKLQWNDFFSQYNKTSGDIVTPEDFSDEDQLISKTTEQFVKQDVIPHIPASLLPSEPLLTQVEISLAQCGAEFSSRGLRFVSKGKYEDTDPSHL